jgi:hypothetical protein
MTAPSSVGRRYPGFPNETSRRPYVRGPAGIIVELAEKIG